MSTIKSKKVQLGTDANAANNFTLYQPATPDGTLRIGVGNADSPTEVGRFDSNGYVATNAPVFSAYANTDLTISDATYTKVPINTVRYDVTSDFDTTNYRFQPSVAGYYQVNGDIRYSGGTNILAAIVVFYKNGSQFEGPNIINGISTAGNLGINGSTIVYMNGTTDYVELYGWTDVSGGTPRFDYANVIFTSHFSGFLIRAV